ncbi:hypothetical protein [Mesorhizobium sp. WSM2239]
MVTRISTTVRAFARTWYHEDLYVGKNVTVGSTDTVAILAPGSFHTAIVDGAIVGDLSGLFLGSSAERAVIKSCM